MPGYTKVLKLYSATLGSLDLDSVSPVNAETPLKFETELNLLCPDGHSLLDLVRGCTSLHLPVIN